MNLEDFYNLIKNICPTYHYESCSEEYPKQIYTEYATNYEYASNNVFEIKTSIILEHYSKEEFDKTEKILELNLALNNQISFTKETSFNEELKLIINSYDIEITEELNQKELIENLNNLLNEERKDNA